MNTDVIHKLFREVVSKRVLPPSEESALSFLMIGTEKVDPKRMAIILYDLGLRSSAADDADLASRLYEAAMDLGYYSDEAYYNLGNARLKLEQYPEAIDAYSAVINLNRNFAFAYYNRGLAYSHSGNENLALNDFTEAALRGCDLPHFFDAFARHQIAAGGFESLYRITQIKGMPMAQKSQLLSALQEKLAKVSYLLREFPQYKVQFSEKSLPIRAMIGDVFLYQDPTRQVQALFRIAEEVSKIHDEELEWRVQYLLGVMPYYLFCEQVGRENRERYDLPDIVLTFAFLLDSPACDDLDQRVCKLLPDLKGLSRIHRIARFAQKSFQRSAQLLCDLRKTNISGIPQEAVGLYCSLGEDVFRELIRTSVYLNDSAIYFSALEQSKFHSLMLASRLWSKGDAVAASRYLKVLEKHFRPVRLNDVSHALGGTGILFDFYVYEIVEDAITAGVVTASSARMWERFVEWLTKEDQLTDLDIFLRNFRQWKNRDEIPTDSYPRRMNDLLLGPASEELSSCSRVAILPFNYLHNTPFHALDTIRALVEREQLLEVVYLPSLRFLVDIANRKPKARSSLRCLFVGFSEGDDIEISAELEIVRSVLPNLVTLTGENATKKRVLSALPRFDVIHFVCHGRFNEETKSPFLVLADDSLYPEDVLALKSFSPELVFLNACVTGVVSITHGRGDQTLGLHTALLLSGARQVIATMWEANVQAAVEFAEHFYGTWLSRPEMSTAQIVLRTQRFLKNESEDIFFWACHALFGDWR